MPRRLYALTGLSLLLVGCSAIKTVAVAPTPSAQPPATPIASWVQDLTLTGDIKTSIRAVAPNEPKKRSECTGKNSWVSDTYASTIFWLLKGERWALVVLANEYRGPGVYNERTISLQVHNSDNTRVWHNEEGDRVMFVIAPDEESGTVDATLTNLTAARGKLRVRGQWSCGT
jgi:hypothetical protein